MEGKKEKKKRKISTTHFGQFPFPILETKLILFLLPIFVAKLGLPFRSWCLEHNYF